MSTINQLSAVSSLQSGDQVPMWSTSQGDSRKFSLTTLVSFLATGFTFLRASSYLATTPVTVANLPSAATAGAGARAHVTDATSTTFNAALVGGGANSVPVWSNGTAWFVG